MLRYKTETRPGLVATTQDCVKHTAAPYPRNSRFR